MKSLPPLSHSQSKRVPGAPIALVSMPWGSVLKPSLALALLKPIALEAGFAPEPHHLNIAFAQRIGLRLYEHISDRSFFHPEWFFAQLLFGPQGLAEIKNGWNEIQQNPDARELVDLLVEMADDSQEVCKKIAYEHAPQFIDDCLESIDWGRYMAVGFTTTFAQSLSSVLLAKRIKDRHPHVKIIFGGANVDSEMGVEYIRGFPWIDYVVHGEGEHSFPQLLRKIEGKQWDDTIPGVSMRKGDAVRRGDLDARLMIEMNDSVLPDYSDYVRALETADFRKKIDLRLYFESSRGCWWGTKHQCTFCGLNGTSIGFRCKRPDKVCAEIEQLAATYHCLTLSAADNILAPEYFSQLLPRLKEMDIDLNLFYEVKANLTREQLAMLRDAGVREIQPGIESFNSRILGLMNKGVTAIQNIQLLKWCHELEVSPIYSILFGFPGETTLDYDNLPHIFRILAHLQPPANLQQVIFERFSPYYFNREHYGLTLSPNSLYQFVFPATRVDINKIAYYFQGTWEGGPVEPARYMQNALAAWHAWQKQWRKHSIYCYYEKGPNYVIIHDNRPSHGDSPAEHRRICLDLHVSAIYLFCDQSRSRRAIVSMMRSRFGNDADATAVQIWLDYLVEQNLMYCENNRYLSLAVRKRASRGVRPQAAETAAASATAATSR